jgi:hypothetical protein
VGRHEILGTCPVGPTRRCGHLVASYPHVMMMIKTMMMMIIITNIIIIIIMIFIVMITISSSSSSSSCVCFGTSPPSLSSFRKVAARQASDHCLK